MAKRQNTGTNDEKAEVKRNGSTSIHDNGGNIGGNMTRKQITGSNIMTAKTGNSTTDTHKNMKPTPVPTPAPRLSSDQRWELPRRNGKPRLNVTNSFRMPCAICCGNQCSHSLSSTLPHATTTNNALPTHPSTKRDDSSNFVARINGNMFSLCEESGEELNAMSVIDPNKFILSRKGKWVRVSAVVDSGATDSAMNADVVAGVPTQPSEGSVNNKCYRGAGGEKIPNQGEKKMTIRTGEGQMRNSTWQIAPVKRSPVIRVQVERCGQRCNLLKEESAHRQREDGGNDKTSARWQYIRHRC